MHLYQPLLNHNLISTSVKWLQIVVFIQNAFTWLIWNGKCRLLFRPRVNNLSPSCQQSCRNNCGYWNFSSSLTRIGRKFAWFMFVSNLHIVQKVVSTHGVKGWNRIVPWNFVSDNRVVGVLQPKKKNATSSRRLVYRKRW